MSVSNVSSWMLMGDSQDGTKEIQVLPSQRPASPAPTPATWPDQVLTQLLPSEQRRECFYPVGERRGGFSRGTLCLSNAYLYYYNRRLDYHVNRIPLWAVHRVTLATTPSTLPTTARTTLQEPLPSDVTFLEVACKTLQVFQFFFTQVDDAVQCQKVLQDLCFSATQKSCFAFHHSFTPAPPGAGWTLFQWQAEFDRLRLDPEQWRLTDANRDYKLVPSYPPQFIVPRALSDADLKEIALFRSSGRMPVLSWRHGNGASITRCSQPLVGILWARSPADEKLLESIRQLNPCGGPLRIVDCRSLISAYANKAKRGGTESLTYYKNCTIDFMGIDNIHVMRESMRCVENWTTEQSRRPTELTWKHHVCCVLTAAHKIAKDLNGGTSVLIHCSDGWDRTAQLSSLVQILLDPYYRTVKGFEVLIEKEWLQLGHKFAERVGHGRPGFWTEHECSPVFLQFLDCVYQLLRQFPKCFAFSEQFLWTLMDNVYGCVYGTFLYNNERERALHQVKEFTPSLWSALDEQLRASPGPSPLLNGEYDESVSNATCLVSSFSIQQVQWCPYYYRTEGARRCPDDYKELLFSLPEKSDAAAYLSFLPRELLGEKLPQVHAHYHVKQEGGEREKQASQRFDEVDVIEDYKPLDLQPAELEEFLGSPFFLVPHSPDGIEEVAHAYPSWTIGSFASSVANSVAGSLAQLLPYPCSILPMNYNGDSSPALEGPGSPPKAPPSPPAAPTHNLSTSVDEC